MPRLGRAVRDLAVALRAELAGAGIPTDLDPGAVPVPGAWLSIRQVTPLTLGEGWEVRFHLYLVVPDAGALEAWDGLSGLLDKALTVVEPDEPINTSTAITLPHTPTQPLPAVLIVVDQLVDAEED